MDTVTVMQARTSSSRLPSKVLFPINNIPLVVLAAKRASNTGNNVIVATSEEESDEELCNVLTNHDISFFRGNLHDTLSRFNDALSGYDEQSILVRLTADNCFPDGSFIDEVVESFKKQNIEYLTSNGKTSGLPYGFSIEITRVKYLREAASSNPSNFEKEHVTPIIFQKYKKNIFRGYEDLNKYHLNCSIDTLSDYLKICKVFKETLNPINIPAIELISALEKYSASPVATETISKLIFGTAQLGMNYGIANDSGKPSAIVGKNASSC